MIQDILELAAQKTAQGQKVAFVTVTETQGSSPASCGQVMVVMGDATSMGTVGGGATEHKVVQMAVKAIKEGEKVFSFSFDHAENGMVCGGGMSGVGTVLGSENHLFIFGGGHVGQSLAPLAVATGFGVTVVEDREELKEAFSGVKFVVCEPKDYEKALVIPQSAYVVICTRGHKTDDVALRFCLGHQTKYLGMIGSAKKVDAIFAGLRSEGFDEEKLKEIYTPIGLNVASAIPAEIAVSIMAEILMVKNNGTSQHKKVYPNR